MFITKKLTHMNYRPVYLIILALTFLTQPVKAQDGQLPNNAQQQKSWQCVQKDKAIAVLAKDVNVWKSVIEGDGWQCQETVVDIQGNDRQFSCEPNDTIGVLTVTWLQGTEGKQQMTNWVEKMEKDNNLSCTVNESSQYLAP